MDSIKELIKIAKSVRSQALARYSGFRVGAALITRDGKIFTGVNIESSSYGLTICAERVALFKALSEGETQFETIAIVADGKDFCPPCGACRQVLWDYAPEIQIVLANSPADYETYPLKELLPKAFAGHFLK